MNTEKEIRKNILAITACPVGVAHTYMAKEKIELSAEELGFNVKVETHGSIGIKDEITAEDVHKADLVIVAVAAGASDLRLERFNGKPLIQVEIKEVLKDAKAVINNGLENAKPYLCVKTTNGFDTKAVEKKGLMKHIMSGVGFMVPFVVAGGIMIALSVGISQIIWGVGKSAPYPHFLWFLGKTGEVGFQLMIPILAGYIAHSIAGRAALAPAMITAFLANTSVPLGDGAVTIVYPIAGLGTTTPAGFLGALLIGPVVGYTVKWIISWKVPKSIAPVMPIFFIPIIVTFVYSFIFIYAIGAPIGFVMSKLQEALSGLPIEAMAAIGLLLGAMAGFDMGGPINKIAFLTGSGLIGTNPEFMGVVATAIPVAPIGMGLTTLIFRKYFDENERGLGLTALLLGFIGISEGAIPFALKDPKRAIAANVIGSSVAGAVAGGFFVTDMAAHGGPIVGILGAVSSSKFPAWVGILVFFLTIILGSVVTMLIYGGLLVAKEKNIPVLSLNGKRIKNETINQ